MEVVDEETIAGNETATKPTNDSDSDEKPPISGDGQIGLF